VAQDLRINLNKKMQVRSKFKVMCFWIIIFASKLKSIPLLIKLSESTSRLWHADLIHVKSQK